jgi:hypothetical protein
MVDLVHLIPRWPVLNPQNEVPCVYCERSVPLSERVELLCNRHFSHVACVSQNQNQCPIEGCTPEVRFEVQVLEGVPDEPPENSSPWKIHSIILSSLLAAALIGWRLIKI